jgi:cytochrome c5
MLKRYLLLTAICAVTAQTAYAIQPEFYGNNGILAKVFQTNCLACHSSARSGSARNGAPAGLNWDDYGTVVANFDHIVVRAVIQQTMPPTFSGIPKLNQEQQNAMLAWQAAGFPAISPVSVSDANFDFISRELTLPVVIVGPNSYEAKLRMIPMASSPTGFGFELVSAMLTASTSAKAATFIQTSGAVTIPEVILLNGSGTQPSNLVSVEMTLVPGRSPFQFAVNVVTFLSP